MKDLIERFKKELKIMKDNNIYEDYGKIYVGSSIINALEQWEQSDYCKRLILKYSKEFEQLKKCSDKVLLLQVISLFALEDDEGTYPLDLDFCSCYEILFDFIRFGKLVKCLNCGERLFICKTQINEDDLGEHFYCNLCNSSSDL